MASGETRYLVRQEYPTALERGRPNTVACPLWADGALVAPTSGTAKVYEHNGELVSTQSTSNVSSVATATIPAADLEAYPYGEHWRIEWALVISGVTHTFRHEAALVRYALVPVVTDADLLRRHPDLTTLLPDSNTGHQDVIEEAFATLQNRLWAKGNRPHLIVSSTAFREWLVCRALELRFRGYYQGAQDRSYLELANHYRDEAKQLWDGLSWQWDVNEDGLTDEPDVRQGSSAPVFMGGGPRRRRWVL